MFGYVGELRSITQGKGEFSMEYARYAPVRPDIQEALVQAYQEKMGIADKKKQKR